jgi:hypothetical protein
MTNDHDYNLIIGVNYASCCGFDLTGKHKGYKMIYLGNDQWSVSKPGTDAATLTNTKQTASLNDYCQPGSGKGIIS